MSYRVLVVAVVLFGCLGNTAATSISYGPWAGYFNVDAYDPIGQTFKATSRQMSRAGFWVAPWGSSSAPDIGLRIALYEEGGRKGETAFTGKLLATGSAIVKPVDQWGQGWADAWFSTVDLVPGRTYSLRLMDGGGSAARFGLWQVSQSIWGSVYPDGVSIRNGIVDYTWEDLAFRVLDAIVPNGTFTGGGIGPWTPRATGSGSVGTEDLGGGNHAAVLTAGSEVGMSQAINTLAEPFLLAFDYAFRAAGALEVALGSERMALIEADGAADFVSARVPVTNPVLFGLTGGLLDFSFTGETGAQLLLDNIYIEPVPEPATCVLALAGLALALRKRRSPR